MKQNTTFNVVLQTIDKPNSNTCGFTYLNENNNAPFKLSLEETNFQLAQKIVKLWCSNNYCKNNITKLMRRYMNELWDPLG